MREIKFRAWVETFSGGMMLRNVDNIWWYNGEVERIHAHILCCDNLHVGLNFKFKHDEEPITLLQYTGLKDKNGVEIYEGDVLERHVMEWWTGNAECEYPGWMWVMRHKDGSLYSIMPPYNGGEVIGNIYENKELIK